jgi:hypothetical protein
VNDKELTSIERADMIALHLRMHNQHEFRSDLPLNDFQNEEDVICFWMTNVLDLMSVPERDAGQELSWSHESSNPSNHKNDPKR